VQNGVEKEPTMKLSKNPNDFLVNVPEKYRKFISCYAEIFAENVGPQTENDRLPLETHNMAFVATLLKMHGRLNEADIASLSMEDVCEIAHNLTMFAIRYTKEQLERESDPPTVPSPRDLN
jgi:hypothetical protein